MNLTDGSQHASRRVLAISAALLMATGLAACSSSSSTAAPPSPRPSSKYPVTVTSCGVPVTYDQAPQRAVANDIISYSAAMAKWQVVFDSRTVLTHDYVLNLHTNRQLRWTGREWLMSIDSLYGPGYWRLAF